MGGAPWTVEVPLPKLMVIGYDVCHDTRSKERSFGAFVATMDRQMTQYYSIVNAHTSGEELSGHMSFNIATALKKYRERNSKSLTLLLTEGLPACLPSSLGFHVIYRNWYKFRFKKKKCNIYNPNGMKSTWGLYL